MRKNCWRIIVVLMVVILMPINVYANVDNDAVYGIQTNEIMNWPVGPDIYSDTGVLMEAATGEVLYDKGMNEKRYPASVTKIMTALLALENVDLDEEVVFTNSSLEGMYEGTNIGMQEGEVLTMEQSLQVLLIKSANEVANQIAEHVGGSQEGFATMMNNRAAELGCANTHFVNASGMPDTRHYTTAYDMALIFREAIKNEKFRELISTLNYTLEPTNKNPEVRSFSNAHAVFVPNVAEHYEGCIGGKTGVTQVAGSTLVTGATRNGVTYIAVVLRAADHGQACADTSMLFDYGYNNFGKIEDIDGSLVAPKEGMEANLYVEEVNGGADMEATYRWNDHVLGSMKLSSVTGEVSQGVVLDNDEVAEDESDVRDSTIEDEPVKENETSPVNIYRIIIVVLLILVGAGLVMMIVSAKKNKSRRRR